MRKQKSRDSSLPLKPKTTPVITDRIPIPLPTAGKWIKTLWYLLAETLNPQYTPVANDRHHIIIPNGSKNNM